jgi:hypothetical protein
MGFAHVIDGQRRNRDRGDGFHFNAGLINGAHRCFNAHAACRRIRRKVNLDMGNILGMAHGDEFRGFLGGHDTGNTGGLKDIAFFHFVTLNQIECFRIHMDRSAGDCRANRRLFCGYIHHPDPAFIIDVGKFRHDIPLVSYI